MSIETNDLKCLKITDLSLVRNSKPVLNSINLTLEKGKLLLITGPSGSGKTSLALAVSGLIPQHYPGIVSGKISIDDMSPETHSVEELSSKIVCVLSDSWNRFFQITVEDELAFGPRNLGFSHSEVRSSIVETAKIFDLLPLLKQRVDSLSGGQLQRLALAAAFAMKPDYLILDEPSSCMDRFALDQLHDYLALLRSDTLAGIIILEHRLTDFLDISDEIMILNKGRQEFRGTPEKFREKSIDFARKFGIRQSGYKEPASWNSLVEQYEDPNQIPVIRLDNICAGFDHNVLNNVSLPIYPGVTALTGPNGSGKTTLACVIAGILKASSGSVIWSDLKQNRSSPNLPDGRFAGLLQQDASSMLFKDTVYDEIAEGPRNYNIPDYSDITKKWITIADLSDDSKTHPLNLSTGQMIRTAAAATVILQPQLLILDEPARGQDWYHLEAILQKCILAENLKTIACIIITHDYKVIHRFADNLVVMDNGHITAHGKLKKNTNE